MRNINITPLFNSGLVKADGVDDRVNFIIAQLAALLLSVFFKNFVHNGKASIHTRHLFNLLGGVCLGYFCFGYQICHIFIQSLLSYIVINNVSPEISQKVVMFVSLLYLSSMHMQRQFYSYGSYTLDVTGPLMIVTQRVTSLAFNIHDGYTEVDGKLTKVQERLAVRNKLSSLFLFLLQENSFTSGVLQLHFPLPGIDEWSFNSLCGICKFYEWYKFFKCEYDESMFNESALLDGSVKEPSAKYPVLCKLFISFIFLLIIIFIQPEFPSEFLCADDFTNHSYLWIMGYLVVFTNVVRFKYYFAWYLSEAVCNASGLGFNGYDENNNPKWNGVSNVDIYGCEFSPNLRGVLSCWNVSTQTWLKRYCYERVPHHKILITYVLSSVWHGFYPGYYLTFITGALFTETARVIRRHVRPLFQGNKFSVKFYDIVTILTTRVIVAYMGFSFIILHFVAIMKIYMSLYFSLHILAIIAYLILPVLLPQVKNSSCKVNSAQNNNTANHVDKNT
ncbi:Membrane-bound O-acyltransferase domain-containing protein 2 [Nymphon striatum]|nr:Membrane-bound O-acyltransferase domain-containing protein 2 [Nymphon striatum]